MQLLTGVSFSTLIYGRGWLTSNASGRKTQDLRQTSQKDLHVGVSILWTNLWLTGMTECWSAIGSAPSPSTIDSSTPTSSSTTVSSDDIATTSSAVLGSSTQLSSCERRRVHLIKTKIVVIVQRSYIDSIISIYFR